MSKTKWNRLDVDVKRCQRCPRLIEHCQNIARVKRKAYRDSEYWGKPVPNFGVPNAGLLIVGLAPGAHGSNRTGRMFTGDRSGEWLYRAMHRSGFASQPNAESLHDGLELFNSAITSICRCAPPDNKPNRTELENCHPFLRRTFELSDPTVLLTLGSLAWNATIKMLVEIGWMTLPRPRPKFGHGKLVELPSGRWLLGCYHPSQQNTFTGRLTETMLDDVFATANRLLGS